MRKFACLLAAIFLGGGQAAIADQFQRVQCGGDILKALIGARSASLRENGCPVLSAWKIDQKRAKFVKASIEGLHCPRSGIDTVDGGR